MGVLGRWMASAGVVLGLALSPAEAAPASEPPRDDALTPAGAVDHEPWSEFLLRYLRIGADGVHRIAYGRVSAADRVALERYLARLSRVRVDDLAGAERIAFWINLYNALVVDLVLEHYPVPRILDIGGEAGPFARPLVEIEGRGVALRDIRDDRLPSLADDPRVQYALSCGAIGCPNLRVEPYDGVRLERQLNEQAMAFVNDPRCVSIDGDRLVVSSLYRWHDVAFGGSEAAIIRHLKAFAAPELAMKLQGFDTIDAFVFDWRLNDATRL